MAIKPGRHHAFYVLVMVAGWIAPPVACLIRFGAGKDLFICTILTLCGYIPGHAYNFYVQNIRNNQGRNRTPKWAIRAGLIKVKDPKSKPKHQWQNRYEERTPTRADGYEESTSSSQIGTSSSQDWDGRGPMPPSKSDVSNQPHKKRSLHLTPWAAEVDASDVEGTSAQFATKTTPKSGDSNASTGRSGDGSGGGSGGGGGGGGGGLLDDNEEFYGQAQQPSKWETGPASGKSSKLRSVVTGTQSDQYRGDTSTSARQGRFENPNDDRRRGNGYYDTEAGDADPWSRSTEDPTTPTQAKHSSDPLSHHF